VLSLEYVVLLKLILILAVIDIAMELSSAAFGVFIPKYSSMATISKLLPGQIEAIMQASSHNSNYFQLQWLI